MHYPSFSRSDGGIIVYHNHMIIVYPIYANLLGWLHQVHSFVSYSWVRISHAIILIRLRFSMG